MKENKRHLIIGDVHGRYDLLVKLLLEFGFRYDSLKGEPMKWYNTLDYQIVSVGDLNDYGDEYVDRSSSLLCIETLSDLKDSGWATIVKSNHQDKLYRYLCGNKVTSSHGLNNTIKELEETCQEYKDSLRNWLNDLPLYYEFTENDFNYVVVHAYFDDYMYEQTYKPHGLETTKQASTFKARCIYGMTNAEGRIPFWEGDWASRHITKFHLVSGHYHRTENEENFTMIDTDERAIAYYLPGVNRIGVIK